MKQYIRTIRFMFLALMLPLLGQAQIANDSLLENGTLENIIQYALKHQPAVQKSILDEQITKSQVNTRLADWYPQIGYNYSLQHNFQLQTAAFQGQIIQLGNRNTSLQQFAYTQNILNPALVFAAVTAKDAKLASKQITTINKVDVVTMVSKAFYDVLLTQQQIKVSDENIARLERSVKDSKAQYNSGIVDKTDYQRATILLNNAIALKKSNEEGLKAKVEYLKTVMGYPAKSNLNVVYDSLAMENSVTYDVAQTVDFTNRPEYQLLQTQKSLQVGNLKYSKFSFLPSIQGNAAYNMNYLNDDFSQLYNNNYPQSYAGITVALPLVAGGKRWMNIRQAKWQLKKADWDLTNSENNINAEYAGALAAYNSNLANYTALRENKQLAQEVYDVIQLQYRNGVKTYLELLIAESDLRTSQINYYNALYQVLSSKVDLQKALGQIKF